MILSKPTDWSGPTGDRLRSLWLAGRSEREIMRLMKLSRETIQRGARILALPKRENPKGSLTNFLLFGRNGKKQGPLSIPDNEPRIGSVPMADLKPKQCRYPFGDPRDKSSFGYCGAKTAVAGASYCPAHMALCHIKRIEPKAEEIAA